VAFKLAAAASYMAPSDIVFVHAWLEDDVADAFRPKEVKLGVVELLTKNSRVIATANFDSRHWNADGGFHFSFLHPAEFRDLTARVTVETFQNGSYLSEVPVVQETVKEPLEQQPGER
jgi:hypothetical protein